MFEGTHEYDFSFVSPQKRPRTQPELVFEVQRKHLPEICSRLFRIASSSNTYVTEYLLGEQASFLLPTPDLFGNNEFGYGECGYVTEEEDIISLRVPLGPETLSLSALTINLLFSSLGAPFEEESGLLNKQQQTGLVTILSEPKAHGHSVGGYVDVSVVAWLKKFAIDLCHPEQTDDSPVDMHPEVVKAMRETWYAVNTGKSKGWAKDCRGWVRPSGCFTLICFGNACDLSIYPGQMHGLDDLAVEFGCHNLDAAHQQVTLLAGFAKLLELARSK